jgi:hypothetical protein
LKPLGLTANALAKAIGVPPNRLGEFQRFEPFDRAQGRLRAAIERLERLEQLFYVQSLCRVQ